MKDRVSFIFGGNICALARVIRIHIIGYKDQRVEVTWAGWVFEFVPRYFTSLYIRRAVALRMTIKVVVTTVRFDFDWTAI